MPHYRAIAVYAWPRDREKGDERCYLALALSVNTLMPGHDPGSILPHLLIRSSTPAHPINAAEQHPRVFQVAAHQTLVSAMESKRAFPREQSGSLAGNDI